MRGRRAAAVAALVLAIVGLDSSWAWAASAPTKAAAQAEAAHINLTGRDLPGWTQSPNVTSSSDNAMANRLALCAGAHNPSQVDVVDVNSPYFDQGNAEVTSNVTVVRTAGDGTGDLSAMKSSKLVPCLEKIAVPYVKSQVGAGTTMSHIGFAMLSPAWLPARSFGYRITLELTGKTASGTKTSEDLVNDTFGFLVNEAEVGLTATQVSAQGFAKPSVALEQRLLRALSTRAGKYAA